MFNKTPPSISPHFVQSLWNFVAWFLAWLFAIAVLGLGPPDWADLAIVVASGLAHCSLAITRAEYRFDSSEHRFRGLARLPVSVSFGAILLLLIGTLADSSQVSWQSVAIQWLAALVLVGGAWVAVLLRIESRGLDSQSRKGLPLLIVGAGNSGALLVKELQRNTEWRVVGLLDDDPRKQHQVLHEAPVLGTVSELPRIAAKFGVQHAVIALSGSSYRARRQIIEICRTAGVYAMAAPELSLHPIANEMPKIRRLVVDDLLGRDPVTLDDAGLQDFLSEQVVMVTGAGGSIGSELCLQIAAYHPGVLVLFDQSEFAMYQVQELLGTKYPGLQVANVIGDIKNAARVGQVLEQYAPSVIFHAAAYKHVPLMEENNAWEAVQNNVLGTYILAKAAIENKVKKFVFVSTDKAVNPTNVMGATKRLAEMVCQALQQTSPVPKFEMVRFGNVLGSAGSVIPKFEEQIQAGGPITVTHPDMVRYFMSIPEAAQLVLQAGSMGLGGEIFVMDMGEPIRILDLANDMIRLFAAPGKEIKIVFSGLRPGEKLYEELLADDEHTRATPHPKLRIAKAREVNPDLLPPLLAWLTQGGVPDEFEVRRELKRWVPEYVSNSRPKLKAVAGGRASVA